MKTYILHMRGSDYYKVGLTRNNSVPKRVEALQIGCPEFLEIYVVVDGHNYEAEWKRKLKKYRASGGTEWFQIKDKRILKKLLKEYSIIIKGDGTVGMNKSKVVHFRLDEIELSMLNDLQKHNKDRKRSQTIRRIIRRAWNELRSTIRA